MVNHKPEKGMCRLFMKEKRITIAPLVTVGKVLGKTAICKIISELFMKEKGHSNALTMNVVARLDWKRTGDPMKHLSIQARNPTSVITVRLVSLFLKQRRNI